MKKHLILFAACVLFMIPSQAQEFYGIGGHLSFIRGGAVSNIGIHANGEYALTDKTSVVASFGLFIPRTYDGEQDLGARSSTLEPSYITVPTKTTIGGFQISADAKRYFAGEIGDDFAFYGTAGLGFLSFGGQTKFQEDYDEGYGSFDRDYYEEKERYSNFTLNFGLGIELMTGRDGVLFLEPRLNIPANQDSQGYAIEVNIPATVQINAGYRVVF